MVKQPRMPKLRDETAIFDALNRHLNFDKGRYLPTETMELLKADGTLKNFQENPSQASWSALCESAAQYTRGKPGRKAGERKGVPTSLLSQQDLDQAEVRSRSFARLAARRIEVINLRSRLFKGRLLSLEEANIWLRYYDIRYFPEEWFEEHGIPLVDHTSELLDPRSGQEIQWHDEDLARCVFRTRWEGGEIEVPLRDVYERSLRTKFLVADGHFWGRESSALDSIQRVAKPLAEHYGWEQGDAFIFLITGTPPATPAAWFKPVTRYCDDHSHVHIELYIEPWVSIGSVRNIYEHLQKRMRHKQSYSRGERSFRVFEFIEELRDRWVDASGEIPSILDFDWKRATDEWNGVNPNEPFVSPSKLNKAYESAMFTILHPPYGGPKALERPDNEGLEDE